jgi:hypothetical protein
VFSTADPSSPTLLGMTREVGAPRDDNSSPVSFRTLRSGVRNLQSGIRREVVTDSRSALLADAFRDDTGGWRRGIRDDTFSE